MELAPQIAEELRTTHSRLDASGALLSSAQLTSYYRVFRDRFGPQVLANQDGEALLMALHGHGSKDSLVYWLEFKNDEEFPSQKFGGIGGGSALKFGISWRQDNGAWMTGSPQKQKELTVAEAVEIARRNRTQLLAGLELLSRLPAHGSDSDYQELQAGMDRDAPDVSKFGWGRKYFSLMYPDKLDDYHNPEWERFHLIKLLCTPPAGEGRYLASGRFVEIARQLEMPMNHLTTILNQRDGNPHHYWRIGTIPGGTGDSVWPVMRDQGCVAIGWDDLGDLGQPAYSQAEKDRIKGLMAKTHPGTAPTVSGRKAGEVFRFAAELKERDIVVAAQGQTILGIGTVTGPYQFAAEAERAKHRRPVTWLATDQWKMPTTEGLLTTVWKFKKDVVNLLAIEAKLLESAHQPVQPSSPDPQPRLNLTGVEGRIQAILERRGQVILYGPPGTGKTYWAERAARNLAALSRFGVQYNALSSEQRTTLTGGEEGMKPCVRLCCFHPAYGYEDFIEAYRPHVSQNQMQFVSRPGIFKQLCEDAQHDPRPFYLIIDEINRGDIPRIFGELLTVMEKNKRGTPILLPLTGDRLIVPPNVYIIATMNTADRSIALLDAALRRRFGFIELLPDSTTLGATVLGNIPLARWLTSLNERVLQHVGRDARNLQVGHSYFLEGERPIADFKTFARIVSEEIIPLLSEYCYEDFGALAHILGSGLIDAAKQRVRRELFDAGNEEALEKALLQPCPEITTAAEAIAAMPLDEDDADGAEEDAPEPAA